MPGAPANVQKYTPAPHQLAWQWEERVRNENKQQESVFLGQEQKSQAGPSNPKQSGRTAEINAHIRQLKELRDAERRLRQDKQAELQQLQRQVGA